MRRLTSAQSEAIQGQGDYRVRLQPGEEDQALERAVALAVAKCTEAILTADKAADKAAAPRARA